MNCVEIVPCAKSIAPRENSFRGLGLLNCTTTNARFGRLKNLEQLIYSRRLHHSWMSSPLASIPDPLALTELDIGVWCVLRAYGLYSFKRLRKLRLTYDDPKTFLYVSCACVSLCLLVLS